VATSEGATSSGSGAEARRHAAKCAVLQTVVTQGSADRAPDRQDCSSVYALGESGSAKLGCRSGATILARGKQPFINAMSWLAADLPMQVPAALRADV
jgi:hypothetical protein